MREEVIDHAKEAQRQEETHERGEPLQEGPKGQRQPVQETINLVFWGTFFLLGPGLVGIIASRLALYFAWPLAGTGLGTLVEMVFRFGGVWLALLLYMRWIEKRPLSSIGLSPIPWKIGKGIYPWLYIGLVVLLVGRFMGLGAVWLLAARFIQAGAEESVCRGWILNRISARQGVEMGIIANTLVFVMFHALNPDFTAWAIISLTLFSVLMSLLARRAGHVWWGILIHAGWNWGVSVWN
jgi:membrane protease YdiL (CAAX protease family)